MGVEEEERRERGVRESVARARAAPWRRENLVVFELRCAVDSV